MNAVFEIMNSHFYCWGGLSNKWDWDQFCQNTNIAVLPGYLKNSMSFSSALIACVNQPTILQFDSTYNKQVIENLLDS